MKVRKNGRVQSKERTLSQILSESSRSLQVGATYEVFFEGSWIQAIHEGSYGRIKFSNGRTLDYLDDNLSDNPTWC